MIRQYYSNKEKIYIISILKSKDYKTIIKLLTEEEGIFIFTSGNDEKRYISKEELYNEAKKYKSKEIYVSELKEAIKNTINQNIDKVIMVVRKFLCLWRCSKYNSRGKKENDKIKISYIFYEKNKKNL